LRQCLPKRFSDAVQPAIFAKRTDILGTESDLLAVSLVGDTVNDLDVVRVRENFVSGDYVLW